MKQAFENYRPNRATIVLIAEINEIIETYRAQGYVLTVRQLYYQLVTRNLVVNSEQSYNRVIDVVNRGRLGGYIDWIMIEDRSRRLITRSHWDSPHEIVSAAVDSYYRKRWDNQDNYVEVWAEKDAVSNVLEPVCHKYDVSFMANRGYTSQSMMYRSALRYFAQREKDKQCWIIYLGDHDPSGIDMTRDIERRMGLFLDGGFMFDGVKRIALNMDQVEHYQPPENPAKLTDSRAEDYINRFGYSSWELDALEPAVLSKLLDDTITELIDPDAWDKVEEIEQRHKDRLDEVAFMLENEEDEE